MSERRPSMQSRAVSASYKLTGTHASQHLFRKVWLELRQRLAVYCDARLRLLDEPQHRRTRGLDDRCDLCRLTATPNHELGGSVDAPRCAGEHPRKAAGQIWGQKRDLNPSAAAIDEDGGKRITHVMMLFLPSPRGLLPWSTGGIFRGTEFTRALTLGPWPFYVYLDES